MKKQKAFTQYHFSSKSDGKGLPSTTFRKKNGAGFTLIEILVVIAILGILVTIVTAIGLKGRERARRAAALQFSATVHNTLGAYLVGEWKFEGDVKDTSGNGNNGTIYGNPVWQCEKEDTPGGRGCSLEFDGDDWVTVPASRSLNINKKALTVEAWIKPSEISAIYGTIMYKRNGTFLFRHRHMASNDTLLFIMYDATSGWCYFKQDYPYRAGWRHLVVTYNGSDIKAYADGKEFATSLTCTQSFRENLNEPLVIANTNPDDEEFSFTGYIDNIRIYEEALTSAQIRKLYVEGAEKHGLLAEKLKQ